ncbi:MULTISPECIES: 6-phospho-beta-glucosidase [unclassified Fusibacter]|uniref:6-phospho-beta-glucosidase n=1 Tax=unclassified Fusibacter TaxID=2624464 RepID=UPI0010139068|nr:MULTISPECIES: 6-phospho-beta-glucosidase [unclassified Fusibacter]MCK8060414.1 6-phospho-beta-glucosidase [Fusibacter sp. A2]NPE20297.1 6-phospho-beta-glucosidase [Fusibacter sp. A1]RXV63503.1 6-phospho-beta-glucosidase [Fusibacter sp. A1]
MNQTKNIPLKIAVIGGGSSYTPEIIEGFILRHHELPIKEIWLVDVEDGKEKLETVGNLAKRMVEKAGIDCKVYLTLNRREALKGASFVTTQFRVGQLDARIHDERIPLSNGMLGQETNGVGGFAKALRTIPVILDIAKDMEEICPDAWLINFTNPAGVITETVLRHTKIKAIGLCNVPVNMRKSIASILERDDFVFHATGLNHYVWGRHVYVDGKDIMPELLPKLLADDSFNPKNIGATPYMEEQILATGLMPCYYHSYFYLQDEMLSHAIDDFNKNGTRGEVVKRVEEELFEIYKDEHLNTKPKQLELRGGAYYSEAACELISAIYNDKRSLMIVNVQNNGTLSCLPDDAVIETTCMITNAGALPLNVASLPESAQAELLLLKTYERETIIAAMTGDYGKALHALTIHPLTRSGQILKETLDQVIEQNIAYLPQFKKH